MKGKEELKHPSPWKNISTEQQRGGKPWRVVELISSAHLMAAQTCQVHQARLDWRLDHPRNHMVHHHTNVLKYF